MSKTLQMDSLYPVPAAGIKFLHAAVLQILSFLLILFLSSAVVFAQDSGDEDVVQGTVTDVESGDAMPGVNILVKGTSTGITTDVNGRYELTVPSLNDTLVFSFIGYQNLEEPINGRNEINVELQPQAIAGDELVVVGYGVQRRSEITGSVGIAAEDDLEQPTFNALQSLRGKVSGVNIFTNSGAPTGSNRVVIRGIGSINASADPLYVVDGVVMDNIDTMNPNDIESVEVLKDASATAIYGARGANGVILVTTERGGEAEGITVGYNADFSIGRMRGRMDAMNAEEFMEVQRIGIENAPLFDDYDPGDEPELDLSDERLFDSQGNPLYDTDWQKEATRTALSHDHQFSVQAGGERSSFGGFLNYTDREGIFLNSYMQRANLKLVYDANPTDWLSVGTNLSLNRTWENNVEEGGGGQEVRRTIIEMPPIFPIKWDDGTYTNSTQADGFTFEGQANPVHRLLEEDRLRDRTQIFGNTFLALQITPELEFRTQLGVNNELYEFRNYGPTDLIAGGFPDGNASISNGEQTYWQNENFLTYLREAGPHRINSILGASWQQRLERGNSLNARGFSDDFFRYNNVGTATDSDPPSSYAEDWTMNSYFTRVSYTYDEKYMVTGTARVDGSSRFGEDSKYGFFPSAGVAWLISDENFMADIDFIDMLRLRSSYGVTGNSEIGLYQSLATVGSGTT
ncbi:MAG: SusC/RagA family TonB-linked outer membrane protein, partial [Balneolaceae bacterium]